MGKKPSDEILDEAHRQAIECEKEMLAESKLDGSLPCCNQPPDKPYFVGTEEDITAKEIKPFDLKEDDFQIRLDMDVYVEPAAQLDRRTLSQLLTATRDGTCTKFITAGVPPEQLDLEGDSKDLTTKKEATAWDKSMDNPNPDGWCEMALTVRKDIELPLTVVLSYPLAGTFFFEVPFTARASTLAIGDLVWAVCQAYRAVYADPKHFGVFGHGLGDLVIEYIKLDLQGAVIVPGIGS